MWFSFLFRRKIWGWGPTYSYRIIWILSFRKQIYSQRPILKTFAVAHAHFSLSKYSHCSLSGLQHKKQCSPNILLQTLSRLISLCSHCLHHPKPLTVLKGQCKLHMSYYGPLYTWSICLFLRSATLNNSYSCLMIYIECPFYMKCSLPAWAQLARPLSSLLPSVLCASL